MSASLNLEELSAVNDELAALVRAGVPLEKTLGHVGRDLPGRLGRATRQLAEHLERGESLSQALDAMPAAFPPMYRTAVEAGVRAGRLPVVLEDLSQAARKLADLQKFVVVSAIYPIVLLWVSASLFVFFVSKVAPVLAIAFEGHTPPMLGWLVSVGRTADIWGPPLILATLIIPGFGCLWLLRGRSSLAWLPMVGKMLRDARIASFSEVLSLLIDHDVSLARALPLAADASADKQLATAVRGFSQQLEQGAVATELAASNPGLPPFFVWAISAGERKDLLVSLLRQSAEIYRRRALRRSVWIRTFLPLIATMVFGGAIALAFGLSLFVPLTELLHDAAFDNLLVW